MEEKDILLEIKSRVKRGNNSGNAKNSKGGDWHVLKYLFKRFFCSLVSSPREGMSSPAPPPAVLMLRAKSVFTGGPYLQ